ncbi:hypothetical protein ACTFIU_010012 [Dictyostelium citrinum]
MIKHVNIIILNLTNFFKNDGVVKGGDSIQGNGGNGLEAKVEGTLEIENNGEIIGGKGANKDGNGVDVKDTTLNLNNNKGSKIEGNIGIKTNGGGSHVIVNDGVIIGKEYGIYIS